jgi:osmotically-inducible protein OsmY
MHIAKGSPVASRAARSDIGAVDDELLVRAVFEAMADAETALDCVAALDAERRVPRGAVKVKVEQGWLTLSGEVHDDQERRASRRAIQKVKAILGVTDNIVIASDAVVPSEVAAHINRALRRSPVVDQPMINVAVEGHRVYLDGTVSSPISMREAEDAAWAVPGVVKVIDRLVIDSWSAPNPQALDELRPARSTEMHN